MTRLEMAAQFRYIVACFYSFCKIILIPILVYRTLPFCIFASLRLLLYWFRKLCLADYKKYNITLLILNYGS